MMKVRFREERVVQDGLQGTAHETRFTAGQVVELAEASALHWISRGVAERLPPEEAPVAPPAPSGETPSAEPAVQQPAFDLAAPAVEEGDTAGDAADTRADDSPDEGEAADGTTATVADTEAARPSPRKPRRAAGASGEA